MIRAPIDIPHEPNPGPYTVAGSWWHSGGWVVMCCPECGKQQMAPAVDAETGISLEPMICNGECGKTFTVRLAEWATAGRRAK